MKIKTISDFQDLLDSDFAWRQKEISDLKKVVRRSNTDQSMLIRSGTALVYAHWEGFVKNAAQAYLEFVKGQKLNYNQLSDCFVVLGLKKKINHLKEAKKTNLNIELIQFLRKGLTERANLQLRGAINTESNLRYHVFENILITIGLDLEAYETKKNFIDTELVNRRNEIAHGEFIRIDYNDWLVLVDDVLGLIRQFKTDLENAASTELYLVS